MYKKIIFLCSFCALTSWIFTKINPLCLYTPALAFPSQSPIIATAAPIIMQAPTTTSVFNTTATTVNPVTTIIVAPSNSTTSTNSGTTSVVTPGPTSASGPTTISINPTSQTIVAQGNYVLSGPGVYLGAQSALLISQSNVILDLNGQTISYSGSPSQTVHGIIIAPGIKNVTIKNGSIIDFPGTGIICPATTTSASERLSIENVHSVACINGIICSCILGLSIKYCSTTINTPLNPIVYGIMVTQSIGVSIQQCTSERMKGATGNCYGFYIGECRNTYLIGCVANYNVSKGDAHGIYFENMIGNNYIQNCMCSGNISTKSDSYGIAIEGSSQTYVEYNLLQSNDACIPSYSSYGICLTNSPNNFIRGNSVEANDYGIYDDEPAETSTNIFTFNSAYQNRVTDYLRPYSSPLSFIQISQEHLQGALLAGRLDNTSVRTSNYS